MPGDAEVGGSSGHLHRIECRIHRGRVVRWPGRGCHHAFMNSTDIFFKIYYLFIYLFNLFLAASGLSCGMRDFHRGMRDLLLQRAGFSLVVHAGFLFSSCGTWAL